MRKSKDQILLEEAYESVLKPNAGKDPASWQNPKRSPEEHNARRIANQIGVKLEGRGYKKLDGSGIMSDLDGSGIDYYANNESAVAIELGKDGSFKGAVHFDSPKAGKILNYTTPRSLEDARKEVDNALGQAVGMQIQKIEDLYGILQ